MSQAGASSGLSKRRRGGGAPVAAPSLLAGPSSTITNQAVSGPLTPAIGSPALTQCHSALSKTGNGKSAPNTGGHRIAFDPRDLNDESEESDFPRLTLMEEILLLGLKDRQGYLSFWNDSISYALRGCIIAELLMRKRLRVVRDPSRMVLDVQDRLVEVVNGKMTGEVLLDEALKLIKSSEEKRGVAEWIDLLSGETWNLSKIGYQLKQVRERLAKGLVDKGILRTEKRNFLLFDMATHPIADASAKRATLKRIHMLVCGSDTRGRRGDGGGTSCSSPSLSLGIGPTSAAKLETLYSFSDSGNVSFPVLRSLVLVSCAFAANVLDNALLHLTYESREAAFQKVEDWLDAFGQWPMAPTFGGGIGAGAGGGNYSSNGSVDKSFSRTSSRAAAASRSTSDGPPRIAEGSVLPESDGYGGEGILGASGGGLGLGGSGGAAYLESNSIGAATQDLIRRIREKEATEAGDAMLEGIAGIISVLARMDSLL